MHITAHLDVDVVAHETEDQLSVLIDLTAPPTPDGGEPRPPSTLEVVLDRSGSMGGGRLDAAKTALLSLIDRLDPTDRFGLVAFDDKVEVVAAAGPLRNKAAVKQAIAAVHPRGTTDLSSGYLRGLQEARRVAGQAGATVLLVSDGHANAGITDPNTLGQIAGEARGHNVTTSTLGIGLGYDEKLMSAIAKGGAGNELFAEEADTAAQLISGEVDGLLAQTVQAASLLIRMSPHVRAVQVLNELPVTTTAEGVLAELGSFYAEETRKLLLVFDIPAIAALGLAEVATLEFTYVELPAVVQHTVSVPLHVNVVPGDAAAGRIPDPVVRTEVAYLRAQQAKRRASTHLSAGDTEAALREINDAQATVDAALAAAPPELAADLREEVEVLRYLAHETEFGLAARAAKYSSSDSYNKSSKRGRTRPSS
jgi:Ca-activated chloride channel family protein